MINREKKLCLGYQEALTQLRKHPELIWTRNNFFLLIQSGLLAFTLNIGPQSDTRAKVIAPVAGLLTAIGWLWVNLAGRKLQRKWRKIVLEFEGEIFNSVSEGLPVKGPFQKAKELGEGEYHTLSIPLALILLSAAFGILWIILLVQIFVR